MIVAEKLLSNRKQDNDIIKSNKQNVNNSFQIKQYDDLINHVKRDRYMDQAYMKRESLDMDRRS